MRFPSSSSSPGAVKNVLGLCREHMNLCSMRAWSVFCNIVQLGLCMNLHIAGRLNCMIFGIVLYCLGIKFRKC